MLGAGRGWYLVFVGIGRKVLTLYCREHSSGAQRPLG